MARQPVALKDARFLWLLAGAFTVIGILFISEGIERGRNLRLVDTARTYTLVVEDTKPRPGRFHGEATASGRIRETGQAAEVGIFRTQYDVLVAGNKLEVYALGPGRDGYVFRRKYEESEPIVDLGIAAFSWHAMAGIVFLVAAGLALREAARRRRAAAGERAAA